MNGHHAALGDKLDALTVPATLVERLPDGAVRCLACAHRCLIREGRRGICQVRFNQNGTLFAPYGYAAGIHADPIEKKPFYHVMPGSAALTFGMLGCDMHCSFCQNWISSQTLRDGAAGVEPVRVTASQIVAAARRSGATAVVSSYNEPLITAEWAIDVFKEARQHNLVCGFVSNGNATPTVLDALRPWAQIYKIDLKTMQDKHYRQLGAVLQHILDGIRMVYDRGFWLEIVTLVVPGFNDSAAELAEAARFIASVSVDIPWHVTAFHGDYQMTEPRNTNARDLLRAVEIGREQGLRYVYAGNLPGHVADTENTYCPHCRTLLVERRGYFIRQSRITPSGACPACGTRIPGVWS